jgi:HSP20 family molecular chaperone IbpA
MWDLGMAQAQMDAITSALMPLGLSSSGRLQLPSVELQETADTVIVTAFLPGVDPQEVQLKVTPRSLTFYGQRRTGYRSALAYGVGLDHFQQTIPLPAKVQDRQTQVAYHQGAIVVTLQKARGFWSGWSEPTPQPASPLHDWTLMDEIRHQGERLGRGWRQFKHWLGHRLQRFGNQLLRD